MPDESKPGTPPGTGTPPGQPAGDGGTASTRTFTQDDINRILGDDRKATAAKYAEETKKAKLYDELAAKQKEQEQAQLTEVERLKNQVAELTQFKTRAEEYETSFKELLAAKRAAIPEERRALVPDGLPPLKLLEWIEKNSKVLYGTEQIAAGAPAGGSPPGGKPDPLLAQAEAKARQFYPRMDPNSDQFKAKVKSIHAQLVAGAGSAE